MSTPKTLLKTVGRDDNIPTGSLVGPPPTSTGPEGSNPKEAMRNFISGGDHHVRQRNHASASSGLDGKEKNEMKESITKEKKRAIKKGNQISYFEFYLIALNVLLSTGILLTVLGLGFIYYCVSNNLQLNTELERGTLALIEGLSDRLGPFHVAIEQFISNLKANVFK
jgi:hypothetical protein